MIELDPAAVALWVRAGSYCAQHLTDGVVTVGVIRTLGADRSSADELVLAGLWDQVDARSWAFRNWAEYQPSRVDVEADRAAAKDRMKRVRDARKAARSGDVRPNVQANTGRTFADRSGEVRSTPTRPDPTRPIEEANASSTSPRGDGGFAEFYLAYPRKVGKDAARRAFEKAAKSAGPEVIIAGARRFAADPNLPDKQFIPHPATWLNAGRWDDEPLPPRSQGPMLPPPEDFGQDEWMLRS